MYCLLYLLSAHLMIFSYIVIKSPEYFFASTVTGKDCATKTCSTSQRCNENTFRSVTELSLGGVDAHGLSTIDMVLTIASIYPL